MAPTRTKIQRNTQTRTFTGCGTCRKRHLKGYQSKLLWLVDTTDGNGSSSQQHRAQRNLAYRHPIYSESKRESLSAQLSASTDGRTALNLIAQLDDYCLQSDVDKQRSRDFWTGPFGVFEIRGTKVASRPSEPSAKEISTDVRPLQGSTTDICGGSSQYHTQTAEAICSGPSRASPQDVASNESSVEEIEHFRQDDIFSALEDFDTRLMRLSPQLDSWQLENQFMHDLSMPLDMIGGDFTGLDFFDNLTDVPAAGEAAESSGQADTLHHVDAHTIKPGAQADWAHLLMDAPSLLRCYESANDASKPTKHSFWGTFVLPSAMRTFGELSVFGKATDASSSIFYATLANSAFSMQGPEALLADSSHWRETGKSAEEAAQFYLQGALHPNVPQTDGQELLSATLSMCLVSLYHEPSKTMAHLVEAERLIRRQSVLNLHQSFQYRALLHIYTYFRIVMESICFVTGRCSRLVANGSVERFSVTEETLETGLDPTSEKTSDVGYHDIHLDVNGHWQETLYTKIYGVPETLLTLLSQTVKLANGPKSGCNDITGLSDEST
ncbi:hypothetical protein MBLNU13_g04014t2 [Cladosporium sp. NU13]